MKEHEFSFYEITAAKHTFSIVTVGRIMDNGKLTEDENSKIFLAKT